MRWEAEGEGERDGEGGKAKGDERSEEAGRKKWKMMATKMVTKTDTTQKERKEAEKTETAYAFEGGMANDFLRPSLMEVDSMLPLSLTEDC